MMLLKSPGDCKGANSQPVDPGLEGLVQGMPLVVQDDTQTQASGVGCGWPRCRLGRGKDRVDPPSSGAGSGKVTS